MKSYKVLIRVRDVKTNRVIKNRVIFDTYYDTINCINDNLKVDNIIKLKFFENNIAFGVGSIWYQNNSFINYNDAIIFLKKLFNITE